MARSAGDILEGVRAEVERACAAPENSFGSGIWTHHIVTVVDCGRALSERLGTDAEIVELAALLHDYAGIRDAALAPEYHRHGAAEARQLLGAFGYPAARREHVAACILTHRASRGLPPQALETRCLASAHAMAHIAQLPSLLHLAYARKGLDTDAGAAWVAAKFRRGYAKLPPEAKALVGGRYAAALELLEAQSVTSG